MSTDWRCSFRGVYFDAKSLEPTIEHAVARHAYPWVDGEDLEDMGLSAWTIQVEAVFGGESYLAELAKLLDAVDKTGPGTFEHPLYGRKQCLCERRSERHQHNEDGTATVPLTFTETGTGAGRGLRVDQVVSVEAHGATLVAAADAAAASYLALTKASLPVAAGAKALAATAKTGAAGLAAARRRMTQIRRDIQQKLRELRSYTDVESWQAVQDLQSLAYESRQIVETMQASGKDIVQTTVSTVTSARRLAQDLYGDPDRAADILALNPRAHSALLRPGTTLEVHGR